MAFVAGRDGRLYANGIDLSGYMTAMTATRARDKVETTTFGAVNKTYLRSPGDAGLSAEGLFDNALGAIVPTLDAIFAQTTDSIWTAASGGDVVGGMATCLAGQQDSYEITNDVGDAVKLSLGVFGSTADGCLILASKRTDTATFTGAAVDQGVGGAGTLGGTAYLHVFAGSPAAGTVTAKVQHSADGSTGWADLATFSATAGSASPSAKMAAASGTVNRYLRAVATIAGTTPSFTWWLAFNTKR